MKTLKPMSRLGDITTGHGCYAPSVGVTASPNVMVNGLPAHKVGDPFTPHTCGKDVHSDVAAIGSPKVIINGSPAMRLGDALAPPALMAEASWTVFAA
tara:strand:- start:28907 stop:29200 length:294 start_codon:yes stop_codon:yes gene_type:complete